MNSHPVDAWFVAKALNETVRLDELLADDAIYISPMNDIPKIGRQAARLQVSGIMKLLAEGEHRYVRQIVGANDAVLEFESAMDGLKINGVELLKWDDNGKITEVRVMLRPLDAAIVVRGRMEKLLLSKKRST